MTPGFWATLAVGLVVAAVVALAAAKLVRDRRRGAAACGACAAREACPATGACAPQKIPLSAPGPRPPGPHAHRSSPDGRGGRPAASTTPLPAQTRRP